MQRREETERLAGQNRRPCRDERPGTLPDLDNPHRGKALQSGPHARPAHTELARQVTLGRQPVARLHRPLVDQRPDTRDDHFRGGHLLHRLPITRGMTTYPSPPAHAPERYHPGGPLVNRGMSVFARSDGLNIAVSRGPSRAGRSARGSVKIAVKRALGMTIDISGLAQETLELPAAAQISTSVPHRIALVRKETLTMNRRLSLASAGPHGFRAARRARRPDRRDRRAGPAQDDARVRAVPEDEQGDAGRGQVRAR